VNRALRAATMGVLLLSPVVLSACSAGQVTQTATQNRDKTGAQAQVGDISLRQVELLHPLGGTYQRGDDADLQAAIINGGTTADTLVRVDGDAFDSAVIQSAGTGTATSTTSGATSTSAAGTTASPSTSTPSRGSTQGIEILPGSTVFVGGNDFNVTLINLHEDLTTGQYIDVTFTFENAGSVTVPVSVATPGGSETRGETFDFHQEAGTTHG
jgi:copper(I)-binding protein